MALTVSASNVASVAGWAKDGSPAATAAMVAPAVTAASATAGAATCAALAGRITSEALTSAQNAIYTLTITNGLVAAEDQVFASVHDGTNTQGTPMIVRVTPAAGSIVITVANKHASSEALNGTIVVDFRVFKAGA